jgi:transposase
MGMNAYLLLPEAFALRYSSISGNTVAFGLMSITPFGTCPLCSRESHKVHSYYQRKVGDLPISGRTVKLYISTRKFFCQVDACPRKVFAERFGACLRPWQRRLERSNSQIQAIGLRCGSKPGARVCEVIGLPVSASTILRVMRKTALPEVVTPKVLGVDEVDLKLCFIGPHAFKKGHTYGTILVDLEKRVPVDLLPDREGKTLEEWLKAHPGVEMVTRDRSPVYANAITMACPDAVQIADRWWTRG